MNSSQNMFVSSKCHNLFFILKKIEAKKIWQKSLQRNSKFRGECSIARYLKIIHIFYLKIRTSDHNGQNNGPFCRPRRANEPMWARGERL